MDWALIKVVTIYVIFIVGLCIISEWVTGGCNYAEGFDPSTVGTAGTAGIAATTQSIFNSMQGQIKDEITKRLKQMKGIPETGNTQQPIHQQPATVTTNAVTTKSNVSNVATGSQTQSITSPVSESFVPMIYDTEVSSGLTNTLFNIIPQNAATPGQVPNTRGGIMEKFSSFAYPQSYEDSVISKAKQELDNNSNAIFASNNVVPTDIKWSDCLSPPQDYVTVDAPVNYKGMEARQSLEMNKRTLYVVDGKYKFDTSKFPDVQPIGCDF